MSGRGTTSRSTSAERPAGSRPADDEPAVSPRAETCATGAISRTNAFAGLRRAAGPSARSSISSTSIALEDDYFIERKLYPNVDFYSGLIYEALGLPVAMFPVMFAIGRTSGWIAQWREMVEDDEQKISRPRQIYTGERSRDYVPIDQR